MKSILAIHKCGNLREVLSLEQYHYLFHHWAAVTPIPKVIIMNWTCQTCQASNPLLAGVPTEVHQGLTSSFVSYRFCQIPLIRKLFSILLIQDMTIFKSKIP